MKALKTHRFPVDFLALFISTISFRMTTLDLNKLQNSQTACEYEWCSQLNKILLDFLKNERRTSNFLDKFRKKNKRNISRKRQNIALPLFNLENVC